ncbi:MAG TPA: alkaline phosphatase family protein, partial [Vicinamibacterales bacterium]|nr:alkaline phosphatase family protein [Vicinamibacterales bacterium]
MPAQRVALLLLDGASAPVLQELLAAGDLPNLARHVVEPGSMVTGTTVFPSTTGVAYIPLLFGCYPGTLGIPGIRWLNRGEAGGGVRAQWRAARSYCGPQGAWLNRDIAPA